MILTMYNSFAHKVWFYVLSVISKHAFRLNTDGFSVGSNVDLHKHGESGSPQAPLAKIKAIRYSDLRKFKSLPIV